MKHLLFGLLAISLILASCSTEDIAIEESTEANQEMLESFILKRNSNGSYALSLDVQNGTGTMFLDDAINNEVHLTSDGSTAKTDLTHDYILENNELNISFISENNSKSPSIRIIDDNTDDFSSKNSNGLLDTYSFDSNEDGTIHLSFKVQDGVDVAFGYNEMDSINDIYLTENTNATQQNYSKSYDRGSNGMLKIDFIQSSSSSKSGDLKKPRIIFSDGNDD